MRWAYKLQRFLVKLPFCSYGFILVLHETATFGGSMFNLNIAQEKSNQYSITLGERRESGGQADI